jgi:hypothetical protein
MSARRYSRMGQGPHACPNAAVPHNLVADGDLWVCPLELDVEAGERDARSTPPALAEFLAEQAAYDRAKVGTGPRLVATGRLRGLGTRVVQPRTEDTRTVVLYKGRDVVTPRVSAAAGRSKVRAVLTTMDGPFLSLLTVAATR